MNSRKKTQKVRENRAQKTRKGAPRGQLTATVSAAALRALYANAPVGIFMSTFEGKILTMNASGAAMFGYTSAETFVADTTDAAGQLFVFPEQRRELVRKALQSHDFVRAEVSYRRKDGSVFLAHLYMRAVRDSRGKPSFMEGFVEDITERKRIESALHQSEARYRMLVERAPLPIGISRNGITVYVNRKFLELFGCNSMDAQVGRPIRELWAPEYRDLIEQRARQRAQGFPVPNTYEGVAQREDGSRVPVQVTATIVDLPDGPATLAFFTDISDLKTAQSELKRHQEHLEELVAMRTADLQAALTELEHMSYSMVHDMRAPLRAMQGFARLVVDECPEVTKSPVMEYLQRIIDTSNRLDRLIRDALGYNKLIRESLPIEPVDISKLLEGLVHSYPNLQPPVAEIIIDPSTELIVLGNETLLTQCFGNLLDNGVKFVARGVHPHIRVWAKSSTLKGRPSTVICIQDNGIGIPKEAQEKIFRMFQRMHPESIYPGTGIGLAIVKKAVERMGGRIGLESEPGRGSTFSVELPSSPNAHVHTPLLRAA